MEIYSRRSHKKKKKIICILTYININLKRKKFFQRYDIIFILMAIFTPAFFESENIPNTFEQYHDGKWSEYEVIC